MRLEPKNVILSVVALGTAVGVTLTQPTFAASTATPDVKAILEANHTAVGKVPTSGGADIDYNYSGDGLTGTRKDIVDLATGAYVEVEQADIVGEAAGFDGKTPWMRDTSGANTPQEGGDRIVLAVNEAYRHANLWWRPGYG